MTTLYDIVSFRISRVLTKSYSTSFSTGISVFDKELHDPVYAIYGFVRLADEIVDTFHNQNKELLLDQFSYETYRAIDNRLSTNPVLHSFQLVVNKYGIEKEYIETFLASMKMDIDGRKYDQSGYEKYILGSAEVVGLMCLKVFTNGDQKLFDDLKYYAMRLGSAFQKINFLRDLSSDYFTLGRIYFPGVDIENFNELSRRKIEADIQIDFNDGYTGIMKLPRSSKKGVLVAYVYYYALFKKIKKTPTNVLLTKRVRISNLKKLILLIIAYLKYK